MGSNEKMGSRRVPCGAPEHRKIFISRIFDIVYKNSVPSSAPVRNNLDFQKTQSLLRLRACVGAGIVDAPKSGACSGYANANRSGLLAAASFWVWERFGTSRNVVF